MGMFKSNSEKAVNKCKKTLNKVALPLAQLLITAHADTLPTTKEFENLADWYFISYNAQISINAVEFNIDC